MDPSRNPISIGAHNRYCRVRFSFCAFLSNRRPGGGGKVTICKSRVNVRKQSNRPRSRYERPARVLYKRRATGRVPFGRVRIASRFSRTRPAGGYATRRRRPRLRFLTFTCGPQFFAKFSHTPVTDTNGPNTCFPGKRLKMFFRKILIRLR